MKRLLATGIVTVVALLNTGCFCLFHPFYCRRCAGESCCTPCCSPCNQCSCYSSPGAGFPEGGPIAPIPEARVPGPVRYGR